MQIREQINQLLAQDINQVLSKQQSMFDNLVGNDYPDFVVFGSGYLGKKVIIPRRKIVLAIPNTLDFYFFWKRVREDFQLP